MTISNEPAKYYNQKVRRTMAGGQGQRQGLESRCRGQGSLPGTTRERRPEPA